MLLCLWGAEGVRFARWCPASEDEILQKKQEVGVSGGWRNHRDDGEKLYLNLKGCGAPTPSSGLTFG